MPPAIILSYARSLNGNASNMQLSQGAIIAIAIAVPVFTILMVVAAVFLYRRIVHGTCFGRPFSRNDNYYLPSEVVTSNHNTRSMISTGYGSYDYYAPTALLGADVSKLYPLTIPQSASQNPPLLLSGRFSSTPPTPLSKDKAPVSYPRISQPRMPLRDTLYHAHGGLKRSEAEELRHSGFSCVFPDITYIRQPSPVDDRFPPVTSNSTESGIDNCSSNEDVRPETAEESLNSARISMEKEEEDSLTHPVYRRGSFASRIAPRTPRTLAFNFDLNDSSRQVDAYTPVRTSYELAEPDFGGDGLDCNWDTVDLGTPYQPPADMYHQLANPIPEIHEHMQQIQDEHIATMLPTAAQDTTTPATITWTSGTSSQITTPTTAVETGTATVYNFLSPSTAPDLRPVSSIYSETSERATSRAPSSAPQNRSESRRSRIAERGLWISTAAPGPGTPTPAREYADMMAWPLPLLVGPPTTGPK